MLNKVNELFRVECQGRTYGWILISQPAITYPKLTIGTLEPGVKYAQS